MSDKVKVRGTDEEREPTENDVVVNGEIVGSDPDANVRESLRKQAESGDSN